MDNILITGATGFVGSAFCRYLKQKNVAVKKAVRFENVSSNKDEINVGDINGQTDWSQALTGVTAVVHTAARVHVPQNKASRTADLKEFNKINVEGTLNLARQASLYGVKRFVFLSSIKVNGEETKGKPFSPVDDPAPADTYALSKLEAERGLKKISSLTGLEVVIIRPPLVYGKGVGGNFYRLLKIVKKGFPLPFGSVQNKRSLVYVENLCNLILVCLRHQKAAGKIFLVSDGEDVSTPQLLRLIASHGKVPLRLINTPVSLLNFFAKMVGRSQEMNRLFADLQVDSSETRELLGWHPPFSLEQGIKRTLL